MNVIVIGGGAAGFFAAISAKQHHPNARVTILEKSNKLLSKVRISGGGRCNVTNGTTSRKELLDGYPRGRNLMKKLTSTFDNVDTQKWFEKRNVKLKTEKDGRVFPVTDQSATIVNCLFNEAEQLDIEIRTKEKVEKITPLQDRIEVHSSSGKFEVDKVIIATGGSPKKEGLTWLEELGHEIVPPIPSLFTFNMPNHPIIKLMGVVAKNAQVTIQGTKLKSSGPLLITHWGMSGPAVLRSSAFGARELASKNYDFSITVNWVNEDENSVRKTLTEISKNHSQKFLSSYRPFDLAERIWQYLLDKSKMDQNKRWSELGKKGINKLISILTNDEYPVKGKTTFKEEFVTGGGISLNSINHNTLESKYQKGLYFAGEVLDIDGITGGYNFQAAWTTGFVAGQLNTSSTK